MRYKQRFYVGSISTVLPRKCGIASFNSNMIENIINNKGKVNDWGLYSIEKNKLDYDSEIKRHIDYYINQDDPESWRDLGRFIVHETEKRRKKGRLSGYFINHENGIFGKHHTQDNLVPLLEYLNKNNVPTITILHTILPQYTDKEKENLREEEIKEREDKIKTGRGILENTDKAIIMSPSGKHILSKKPYDSPRGKLIYIPHGVPKFYVGESRDHIKRSSGFVNKKEDLRPVFTSWGHLSPGKGLEYPIMALSKIIKDYPEVVYYVAGETHPEVLANEGEQYRNSLEQLAKNEKIPTAIINEKGEITNLYGKELKDLTDSNLVFLNRALTDEEIPQIMKGSSFGIISNLGKDQISSGPGAYWIGSSRITIATASPFFRDMEDEGIGLLVPFKSAEDFEDRMRYCLQLSKKEKDKLEHLASDEASFRTWDIVGKAYLNLMEKIVWHKAGLNTPQNL